MLYGKNYYQAKASRSFLTAFQNYTRKERLLGTAPVAASPEPSSPIICVVRTFSRRPKSSSRWSQHKSAKIRKGHSTNLNVIETPADTTPSYTKRPTYIKRFTPQPKYCSACYNTYHGLEMEIRLVFQKDRCGIDFFSPAMADR